MNLPNKITIFRVCLIPVFLIIYMSDIFGDPLSRYIALAFFIIASVTDFADGYIARKQNLVTNFGKFMDPLADKLLVSAAFIAMVGMGVLPSWAVIIIISREFIITGFRLLAVEQKKVIAASLFAKIKTNLQLILIIYVMLGFDGRAAQITQTALLWITVIVTVASGVEYVVKNMDVLKDKPKSGRKLK